MNIAVMGAGITGTAVINKINAMTQHQITPLENADVLVVSPGIPPDQFPLTDLPIISEIELAWQLLQQTGKPPQIVAITGTNGKTTVTAMIGHILDCPVAGNIGQPLISFVPENQQQEQLLPAFIALEVSSYQLETTRSLKPVVSILTNITEDHLTRHKTMENYARIKSHVFLNQTKNDLFIYNHNDQITATLISSCQAQQKAFTVNEDPLQIRSHLTLPGVHNLENALAAAYAAEFIGISPDQIGNKIASFKGVEHRIEYVDTLYDLKCYNDSKGTNPDSTLIALQALEGPGILIMGGTDKLTSLDALCASVKKNVSHTILIGEAAARFNKELNKIGYESIILATDMRDAVKRSLEIASDEKYLLLSPACASFDMYNNYEERGRHFKQIIKEFAGNQ